MTAVHWMAIDQMTTLYFLLPFHYQKVVVEYSNYHHQTIVAFLDLKLVLDFDWLELVELD